MFGPGEIFTFLFVMLGPLKLLGPFLQQTRDLDEREARRIAVRVFAVGLIAAVAGSLVGVRLLAAWHITTPALLIGAGIVFFLVALRLVLEQYRSAPEPSEPLPKNTMAATLRLTFPGVVTPYGIAALIALLAAAPSRARVLTVLGILAGVMLSNLLAMWYARRFMKGIVSVVLYVLGAVLGVLQVGLATQLILDQLVSLGVLAA
jgi:small neutral amino acid transporter SnatA (MarC family)